MSKIFYEYKMENENFKLRMRHKNTLKRYIYKAIFLIYEYIGTSFKRKHIIDFQC